MWGAIDFDGSEALPCAYLNAPLFSEGLAAVYVTRTADLSPYNYDNYYYDDSATIRYIDVNGDTVVRDMRLVDVRRARRRCQH